MIDSHPHQPGDASDRRTGDRQISVLINAGICHAGRDALCRIRNLSSGGVMIESSLPLAVDDSVSLRLRSGDEVGGLVRWVQDGRAGIAFDDPASSALVSGSAAGVQASNSSPIGYPLFQRSARAAITAGARKEQAPVVEISPAGVLIETIRDWAQERLFTVGIDGLGEHVARLGDSQPDDEDRMALIFVQPLHFRLFNDWLTSVPAYVDTLPEFAAVPERPHWA